jgi:hypothetical protein
MARRNKRALSWSYLHHALSLEMLAKGLRAAAAAPQGPDILAC